MFFNSYPCHYFSTCNVVPPKEKRKKREREVRGCFERIGGERPLNSRDIELDLFAITKCLFIVFAFVALLSTWITTSICDKYPILKVTSYLF